MPGETGGVMSPALLAERLASQRGPVATAQRQPWRQATDHAAGSAHGAVWGQGRRGGRERMTLCVSMRRVPRPQSQSRGPEPRSGLFVGPAKRRAPYTADG